MTKRNFPFSTYEDVLDNIREEANHQDMSVNALISSLLSKHIIYYKLLEKKGKVVIPRKSFQFMLDSVEESVLMSSLRVNEFDTIKMVILSKNETTFSNFVKYFLDGLGLAGGFIHHYSIRKDDQGYTHITLEHNYDSKWSRIIGNIISDILKEIFHFNTKCIFLETNVSIKILEKYLNI